MKLLTKEILKRLPALYSQENEKDPTVHVKFFNPTGSGTWLAIEFDPAEGIFFGFCHIHDGELGYFSLAELEALRLPFGLKIERDMHFDPCPLSEARKANHI